MSDTNTDKHSHDLLMRARQLLGEQRFDDAQALYESVLTVDSGNADALHMLGVLQLQRGDLQRAEQLIRSALLARPDFMSAYSNLGAVLMARGQAADAIEAFAAALKLDPEDLDARFNLGAAAQRLGRTDKAIEAYRAVLARDPGSVDARLNLGTALRDHGDALAAVEVFEALRRDHPRIAEVHYNLGIALKNLDRLQHAMEAFQSAVALRADFADAQFNLGNALRQLGRLDEAERVIRELLNKQPGMARAHYALGATLADADDLEGAVVAFEKAASLDPADARTHHAIGNTRLRLGEPQAALQALDHNLRQSRATARDLSDKAIALHMLGRAEEARKLVDLERFLHPFQVPVPEGFADVAAFNRALASHTSSHPTLTDSPDHHATRHGQHSRELLQGDHRVTQALAASIDAGVRDYIRSHQQDPAHPFLASIPTRWQVTSWAVLMRDQGHQIPHIHPTGWLSGVYYPLLPASIVDDDAQHSGWIEFGRPDPIFPLSSLPELRLLRPREGLMLLFPSYVFHRTLPLRGSELRISVAFDVMRID